MCRGCWAGTYGAPIISSDEVLVAAELIRRLYEDLGCPTGGPLHWMLDDMNIDDGQFENADIDKLCAYLFDGSFERWAQAGDDTSDERKNAIKETCALILHALRDMPESHRAAAIAWHEGWIPVEISVATGIVVPDNLLPNVGPELFAAQVAEWTREMNAPPPQPGGTKACVTVPCLPFTGEVSGTVYPGPGQKFAPDAKITGPGVVRSEINPDGSADITWTPPPGDIAEYASLFEAPGLVSMAPVMIDASGFTSGMVGFDPDYRVRWGHPTEVGPEMPPRLRYPHARCSIAPAHLAHPWPFANPKYWCDAQPLSDAESD